MITWAADDAFAITEVEYVCRPMGGRFPSTPDRFCLLKARWQVEWYAQLLRDVAPRTVLEVGMYDGASMALCAELVHPAKLIGIDLRPTPSVALAGFVAEHDLDARVRPYYDTDQTDAARLEEILDAELGAEPLDLVVDDASHLLDATRTTFNRVFPRLRPGARYVIEDWPMHRIPEMDPPLTLLVFELILACTDAPGVVAEVSADRNYVVVTRGAADLDPRTFDISASYGPRAGAIAKRFL